MSEFIEITEPTLILSISVLYPNMEPNIYEATRYAWIVNGRRAEQHKLVLARRGDMVVAAFRPTKWMKATKENFPDKTPSVEHSGKFEDRWAFEGYCCKADRALYVCREAGSKPLPRTEPGPLLRTRLIPSPETRNASVRAVASAATRPVTDHNEKPLTYG